MKKIITVVLVGILLVACKTEEKKKTDGYIVSGRATGVYNGIRVYLQSTDERGRKINNDTAIVMNERFSFEGKVSQPEMWYLAGNSIKGSLPLIIDNDIIEVVVNKDKIHESVVKGNKANASLVAYNIDVNKIGNQRIKLNGQFRAATDDATKAKLTEELEGLNAMNAKIPYEYIKSNNDNSFGLVIISSLLKTKDADLNKLSESIALLSDDLKTSPLAKQLITNIENLKIERAALSATEIGKIAPNFTAPTPDGKQLSLKEAMGKVTIVDFWASWCGPCRRENPNVVKVYEKYHDKGLEIIGVSLDGTNRQKDPKGAWIKAIEEDKLSWNHVSNLQYFTDPVAKTYNIKSIPATLILDENGKVIAKNLRGADLEAKIAELLN